MKTKPRWKSLLYYLTLLVAIHIGAYFVSLRMFYLALAFTASLTLIYTVLLLRLWVQTRQLERDAAVAKADAEALLRENLEGKLPDPENAK